MCENDRGQRTEIYGGYTVSEGEKTKVRWVLRKVEKGLTIQVGGGSVKVMKYVISEESVVCRLRLEN